MAHMSTENAQKSVAVLHGGGYTGRELIHILLRHPNVSLSAVTSRTFAGQPLHAAHHELRGATELTFTHPDAVQCTGLDAVFIAAEHGKGVAVVQWLLSEGYEGAVVDLSADFRLNEPSDYDRWYGYTHPAPELIGSFEYGLTELAAPYSGRRIANPGCFATGMALALRPLQELLPSYQASVTALTGASGSGARPKPTTHYPTRDGNVRAYKVLDHQHVPEVVQLLSPDVIVSLVPVSGPWTRGIWGTVQVAVDIPYLVAVLPEVYESFYGDKPFIRLWPNQLPELRHAVRTPVCDIGWIAGDSSIVIGFALDNLLKGAASQAVQNLNAVLDLPATAGLAPW